MIHKITNTMRTKIIRIATFVLFIVFLGCAQNENDSNASEHLLNNLSERFKQNDYVKVADMGFVNPHEQIGKNVEDLFQKMIKHPLYEEISELPYNETAPTLGIKDPKKLLLAKAMCTEVLNSEGYSILEKQLDDMNSWLSKYALNSEGVITLFNDAEKDKALTFLEHELIKLQLQEVTTAKTYSQIQDISSTTEFEIYNSQLPDNDKSKLLVLNSVIRNVFNRLTPQIGKLNVPPILFSEDPIFLQTAGTEYVVVGVVLLIAAVNGWITAYNNPNCTAPCITAAAAIAWGYIGVDYLSERRPDEL